MWLRGRLRARNRKNCPERQNRYRVHLFHLTWYVTVKKVGIDFGRSGSRSSDYRDFLWTSLEHCFEGQIFPARCNKSVVRVDQNTDKVTFVILKRIGHSGLDNQSIKSLTALSAPTFSTISAQFSWGKVNLFSLLILITGLYFLKNSLVDKISWVFTEINRFQNPSTSRNVTFSIFHKFISLSSK